MLRIPVLLFVLTALAFPVFAEYPPEGWTDSIIDAIATAEAEDKMIMLNFTGSDWCSWCKKLEGEVWSSDEFEAWSGDNLVKVFLDFPRGIDQTDETKLQNQLLQQYFGVRGYPTIIVLDSNLIPLLQTGYRDGGVREYIRHLEEDRNLRVDSPEEFRNDFVGVIEEYIGPVS